MRERILVLALLPVIALCLWAGGYREGKRVADRWYASHVIAPSWGGHVTTAYNSETHPYSTSVPFHAITSGTSTSPLTVNKDEVGSSGLTRLTFGRAELSEPPIYIDTNPNVSKLRVNTNGSMICKLTLDDHAILGNGHTWKECATQMMACMTRRQP